MADVTAVSFDEMEPLYDGLARRARAALGVTAWGMQVMTLPPNWDGYPDHTHDATTEEAGQEEVYVPLSGSGVLHASEHSVPLSPGMMVRVGPEQRRRIVPGDQGIRFLALGGVPGAAFRPSPWTETGGRAVARAGGGLRCMRGPSTHRRWPRHRRGMRPRSSG